MDKDGKVILGLILTCLTMIVALSVLGEVEQQVYRLTLTNEGCTFAASIGLPVEKNKGQCSVDANFRKFAIANGGLLFTSDDKTIEITDSMLLAISQLDTKLPLTPSQQIKLEWFYFLLCIAIAIALYSTFIKFFSKK